MGEYRKKTKAKFLSSVEQAIDAVKWDKQSRWAALVHRSGIQPWEASQLAGVHQGKK